MTVQVRIVPPEDAPEEVWEWVREGNYDGIPLGRTGQHKIILCPLCGAYSVIVWVHNKGGYGKHYGWRCSADRDHQGPLVKVPGECAWLFGQYVHVAKLRYSIDPVDVAKPVAA